MPGRSNRHIAYSDHTCKVVRFACSGSESPVLVAGVQLEVAVAVVALVAGAGVEVLVQVVARAAGFVVVAVAEIAESVDVVAG